jgi:hypothetical protein
MAQRLDDAGVQRRGFGKAGRHPHRRGLHQESALDPQKRVGQSRGVGEIALAEFDAQLRPLVGLGAIVDQRSDLVAIIEESARGRATHLARDACYEKHQFCPFIWRPIVPVRSERVRQQHRVFGAEMLVSCAKTVHERGKIVEAVETQHRRTPRQGARSRMCAAS